MRRKLDTPLLPPVVSYLTTRILSFLLLFLSLLFSGSCQKETEALTSAEEPPCAVRLTIGLEQDNGTRGGSGAPTTNAENAISQLRLMIFAQRGNVTYLEKALSLNQFSSDTGSNGESLLRGRDPVELTSGSKIFLVMANGPYFSSPALPETVLESGPYMLPTYNDPSSRFWLFDRKQVNISGSSSVSLTLNLIRLVGRVCLSGVANNLTGGQSISSIYAFLANAPVFMNASPLPYAHSNIANPDGRTGTITWNGATPSSLPFITGSGSQVSAHSSLLSQTLPSIAAGGLYDTPRYFYACPMHEDIPHEPWLVLAATIDGSLFYYNIPIGRFEANVNQDVFVTLRSLGSDEPCIPNDPGTFEIRPSPSTWEIENGGHTTI